MGTRYWFVLRLRYATRPRPGMRWPLLPSCSMSSDSDPARRARRSRRPANQVPRPLLAVAAITAAESLVALGLRGVAGGRGLRRDPARARAGDRGRCHVPDHRPAAAAGAARPGEGEHAGPHAGGDDAAAGAVGRLLHGQGAVLGRRGAGRGRRGGRAGVHLHPRLHRRADPALARGRGQRPGVRRPDRAARRKRHREAAARSGRRFSLPSRSITRRPAAAPAAAPGSGPAGGRRASARCRSPRRSATASCCRRTAAAGSSSRAAAAAPAAA